MGTKNITPIFLLSLPRSGSTLLQRILSSHSEISSTAEPWILLPFLYQLKKEGTYTDYSHFCVHQALQDLIQELPNNESDYYLAVQTAMLELYKKLSRPNTKYFLDKTPRYALIADEITQVFPDAKIILLWRNPLSVIASIVNTFYNGKWNLFHSRIDLFYGVKELIKLQNAHKNILVVNYENIVTNPEENIKKITDYLNIENESSVLNNFSGIRYKGAMGDPTGRYKYKTVSEDSLCSWKATLANPWRKYWCKKYLNWLGKDNLLTMGYDLDKLIKDIDSAPTYWKKTLSDVLRNMYGVIYCIFELKILKDKFRKIINNEIIMKHD